MKTTVNFPTTINQLLNEVFSTDFNQYFGDHVQTGLRPKVNIFETDTAYELSLLAPGHSKEQFQVTTKDGLLTISYEQKEDSEKTEGKWIKKEFGVKSFQRSFTLNEKIDTEQIVAAYDAGILTITLPKKELLKVSPIAIEVK